MATNLAGPAAATPPAAYVYQHRWLILLGGHAASLDAELQRRLDAAPDHLPGRVARDSPAPEAAWCRPEAVIRSTATVSHHSHSVAPCQVA